MADAMDTIQEMVEGKDTMKPTRTLAYSIITATVTLAVLNLAAAIILSYKTHSLSSLLPFGFGLYLLYILGPVVRWLDANTESPKDERSLL